MVVYLTLRIVMVGESFVMFGPSKPHGCGIASIV